MRANKDALFAKYINREPGTVIPAKAGIQSLQLKKKTAGCPPPAFAGACFSGMMRY